MKRRDFLKSSLTVAALASFGCSSEVFAATSPDLAKVHALIDKNFDEQIAATQKVLRIRSVLEESAMTKEYPFGKETAKCLDAFLDIAREKGFTAKNIDNMVGYIDAGSGEKLLGILGHMDVVPEGELDRWVTPPYEANIIDGKLYARGILDGKGSMVANLYALNALQASGIKLKKRVRMIAGIDEETGFRCVERYLKTEEVPYFSYSPDADFVVVNAEKGLLQFALTRSFASAESQPAELLEIKGGTAMNVVPDIVKAYFGGKTDKIKATLDKLALPDISSKYVGERLEVTAVGTAAHGAYPENGKNAIQTLFGALAKLEFAPVDFMKWVRNFNKIFKIEWDGKSAGIAFSDKVSGPLTVNIGIVNYDKKELMMTFDMRYSVSLTEADANKKMLSIAKQLDAKCDVKDKMAPLHISIDNPDIKTLIASYETVTGEKGEAISMGGATYCRAFPNAISFGPLFPGETDTSHQVNEHVSLESLRKMTHIYAEAIYRICNVIV